MDKYERLQELLYHPAVCEYNKLITDIEKEEESIKIYPPTLADAMRFRREQMNENQRQISTRAGMSLNKWRLLERGQSPSIRDARQLYSVGIPASVLLLA